MKNIDRYFDFLFRCLESDMAFYSGWWVWTILPTLLYSVFFLAKWYILTIPMWYPFVVVVRLIVYLSSVGTEREKKPDGSKTPAREKIKAGDIVDMHDWAEMIKV